MANFNQHFNHALENISHLQCLNEAYPLLLRWQITTTHYSALHLMHAFLAQTNNLHPENHHTLKTFIDPYSPFKTARVSESVYVDYGELEILSKKARYHSDILITEKHLFNAAKYCDSVIDFFKAQYSSTSLPIINLYFDDTKYCKKLKKFHLVERITVAVEK